MGFSKVIYLFGLFSVPILVLFFILSWKNKIKRLSEFGSSKLLKKLIPNELWERQKIKIIIIIISFIFFIITIAGPQFGTKMMNIERKGIDVIIAIDVSLSMLAEDIAPNRMIRAKKELSRLISELEGNRVGIIAFAGSSFLQCPLTLDIGASKMFLDFLNVGTIPQQGTRIGEAINLAIKTFNKTERKFKTLILLTDGEDHKSKPIDAADAAKREGIKIFTIGFGSVTGEPIPIKDKFGKLLDYKKDKFGKTVLSKLDEQLLKRIAFITDGTYYLSTTGHIEINKIKNKINSLEKKELTSKLQNIFEDRFYYFAGFLFLLLLVELLLPEIKLKQSR